jgi:hypothetical protein
MPNNMHEEMTGLKIQQMKVISNFSILAYHFKKKFVFLQTNENSELFN